MRAAWIRLCAPLMAAGALMLSLGGGPLGANVGAQVSRPAQGQSSLEASVRESADSAAASARYALGTINPQGLQDFRRWMLAVTAWAEDTGDGPASALAEGVLFDCLGRTTYLDQGVGRTVYLMTDFTYGREADRRFERLALPDRLEYAAKVLEKAYKADPTLVEARFRALRIRSLSDSKAVPSLEAIASLKDQPLLAYLAAVSLGARAQSGRDTDTALRWYRHALGLHPRSTAATVGVLALDPGASAELDALDTEDPYYDYPCRILTPAVASELSRRMKGL